MNKFFLYAVVVTMLSSGTSWIRAFSANSAAGRGSSWSSHTGGGGGTWGGGSGGSGHK